MPSSSTQFFGPTRGQILTLLRSEARTVNDLAEALKLTDNAVRAHLAELESENLVVEAGQRAGSRKPHTLFALTNQAQELFSRLCVPVLNTLLELLEESLEPAQLDLLIRNIGHRLAGPHCDGMAGHPLPERIDEVLRLLAMLGGRATAEKKANQWVIQGEGCPLAAAVSKHPKVCGLLETLLADLLGRRVKERCAKGAMPQCCFVVGA